MTRRVLVFGPAYLDRVLRVDRPLLPPGLGGPLDLSVGAIETQRRLVGEGVALFDPTGGNLFISPPDGWPDRGSTVVRLDRPLDARAGTWAWQVRGLAWLDDLGGMGAGFASALGGELVCALGEEGDPISDRVLGMLRDQGIPHHPTRVPGTSADWTLLVTSGGHGDKLPIGFRGCHARLGSYPGPTAPRCDLFVAASLTNPLIASALDAVDAAVRVFAPTLRNMTDTALPVSRFADRIDLLCCNRREWESLPDRDAVSPLVPIVSITDGPEGAVVRYRAPSGAFSEHVEPAFPRSRPPVDTNRAGECYASTLLSTLLDGGWTPGPADDSIIRLACRRASAAAALVLDLEHFGFPSPEEIDRALGRGEVA
jgi:ribokinase